MMSDALPGSTPVPCWRHAYLPVSREKRDGVHVADVAYPLVNRTPSRAMRSICGVLIVVAPYADVSP